MSLSENTSKIEQLLAAISALPEAGSGGEQATPQITVNSSGLITATAGDKSATKQLSTQAAQTITPGTSNKTISSGKYLTGTQTIKGDADLIAENIKKGVTIFDVLGTFEGSGGSGGGLPDGIEKLVTGEYIPTSDDTTDYTVTHNFGELPTFMLLMLCKDVSTTPETSTRILQIQTPKLLMASNNTLNKMRGAQLYYGSSSSVSTGGLSDASDSYATTTTATFKGNTTYKLKAGIKYRWVVAVLKDVAK